MGTEKKERPKSKPIKAQIEREKKNTRLRTKCGKSSETIIYILIMQLLFNTILIIFHFHYHKHYRL